MRFIGFLGSLFFSLVGFFGQQTGQSEQFGDVRIQATQITRAGDFTMTMKGSVQVSLKGATVYADEAEYNPLTGELIPSGHVKIQVNASRGVAGVQMDPPMPASPQGH